MKRFRGIVTEMYTYELDIEATDKDTAKDKLEEYYKGDSNGGVFVADGCTFSKVKFDVRAKKTSDYEIADELLIN